jgi:hypothetical protein
MNHADMSWLQALCRKDGNTVYFRSIRSISNEAGQPYPRKGGQDPQKPPRRTGGYRREATCTVWCCESMAFPGEMSTLEDLFGISRLIEMKTPSSWLRGNAMRPRDASPTHECIVIELCSWS